MVTGSSSGIGKAISGLLLQLGYKVYGISRSKSMFKHMNFVWVRVDLTKTKDYSLIFDSIKENKIDILINNAGVAFENRALDFTEEEFAQMFDVNYKAPILLTKKLKEKLTGNLVINISSVSDRLVGEKYALYCSSKAALNRYFDVVALEEKKIKIVSILPSYVDTNLLRNLQKNKNFDWTATIKPKQIAELIDRIIEDKNITTGSKIIAVSDSLKEDLEYKENLWSYNVTTKKMLRLKQ